MGLKLRRPARGEAAAVGALLLDAYQGTTDYEGEDLPRSVGEVEGFFEGKHGRPLPEASVVAWRGDLPVAACFIGWWALRNSPFVVFVATRSDSKRGGVGRLVLGESVRRLARAGHPEVRAVITEGNTASEALFRSLGFADLGRLAPQSPPGEGVSRGAARG